MSNIEILLTIYIVITLTQVSMNIYRFFQDKKINEMIDGFEHEKKVLRKNWEASEAATKLWCEEYQKLKKKLTPSGGGK